MRSVASGLIFSRYQMPSVTGETLRPEGDTLLVTENDPERTDYEVAYPDHPGQMFLVYSESDLISFFNDANEALQDEGTSLATMYAGSFLALVGVKVSPSKKTWRVLAFDQVDFL